ncbi:SPOR domain-containing protein [Noviherbaspirillum aerium]|uniref:SPOR domain-containing protein n=1 Tax=Noviherbaspirillum aerium TaxID=2588497 RepID=UPI00124E3C3E|nr:SPOR domain-containing protein [Noviherbaspirillum aerium]
MSLFSSFRKNKQESASDDSAFYSRAEEESKAVRSRKRRPDKPQAQGAGQADPVLPEKKRARRRLIGAVALVLAAVVGLPMLLDSEPNPIADDIAIQIPSKDKPHAPSSSGAASSAPQASTGVSASAALDPKEEVVDPADIGAPSAAAPSPAPKAEAPKQAAVSKDEQAKPVAPVAKAEVKPEPKHEAKPKPESKPEPKSDKADKSDKSDKTDAKQAEKLAEAARAKALLEGRPDPSSEKNSGKFVIQVAALATKEKVNELQTKLKDAGIKSFTQTVATDTGDRTRIRVGPFTNKDEAEKVRARIVKLGLNGTLVPA